MRQFLADSRRSPAIALVLALAGACLLGARELRASLPAHQRHACSVRGLQSAVTVERDALGIPDDPGHLARRRGPRHRLRPRAGPLLPDGSGAPPRGRRAGGARGRRAPFGSTAQVRVHRFRDEARRTRGADGAAATAPSSRPMPPGVNRGVGGARRQAVRVPRSCGRRRQPWPAEDSLLVVLSMFVTLQDPTASTSPRWRRCATCCRRRCSTLLAPRGTEWDSPILGAPFTTPAVPGPEVYNLRRKRDGKPEIDLRKERELTRATTAGNPWAPDAAATRRSAATAGRCRASSPADGGALVANDMHLDIRVPNTWYRAVLEWRDEADASQTRLLAGLTLPGHPTLVTGSNTHVAWGFTNAQADSERPRAARARPDGPQPLPDAVGLAHVRPLRRDDRGDGRRPGERSTCAGPSGVRCSAPITRAGCAPTRGRRTPPSGWRSSLLPLESARTIEEALDAANGLGTPAQNLVVADRSGRIALDHLRRAAAPHRPRRHDLPESWADGWRGWNGWLTPAEYPRIVDPPGGRLWTANARVVDGSMLRHARRRQLRRGRARPRDPRSAARARAVHGARHAGHPARRRAPRSCRAGAT